MKPEGIEASLPTIPLTSRDVFVFLVPGAALLMLVFFWEAWIQIALPQRTPVDARPLTPVYTALTQTQEPSNWAYAVVYVLVAIGSAYVLGHILSWLAVLALDRILVDKVHGYPYETLLGLSVGSLTTWRLPEPLEPRLLRVRLKRLAYGSLFLQLNFLLVSWYLAYCPWWDATNARHVAQWALKITGFLLIAKLTLSPILAKWWPVAAVRVWYVLGGWLYHSLTAWLGRVTHTTRALPHPLLARFRYYFRLSFGMSSDEAGTENFWLPRILVAHRAVAFEKAIDYWNRLASLSRNLSAAFLASFIYTGGSLIFQHERFVGLWTQLGGRTEPWPRWTDVAFATPLLLYMVACLFLSRFYYLYVSRYTRMLFRCFVYMCEVEHQSAVMAVLAKEPPEAD